MPTRRRALAVFAALAAAALPFPACDEGSPDDPPATRVRLVAQMEGELPAAANAYGYSVTVSRAFLALESLHYFDGAPSLALAPRAPTAPASLSPFRAAHAHPGHYEEGMARGQLLQPAVVDLLAGPVALGSGDGLTGTLRSARLALGPAAPAHAELGPYAVVVEGEAAKEGTLVAFRAAATLDELRDASGSGAVDGCVFDEAEVAGDGLVNVRVRVGVWLDQVDFGRLEGADPADDFVPLDELTANAFQRGVKKASAYRFSFTPAN